jgi:hypothetical protein
MGFLKYNKAVNFILNFVYNKTVNFILNFGSKLILNHSSLIDKPEKGKFEGNWCGDKENELDSHICGCSIANVSIQPSETSPQGSTIVSESSARFDRGSTYK